MVLDSPKSLSFKLIRELINGFRKKKTHSYTSSKRNLLYHILYTVRNSAHAAASFITLDATTVAPAAAAPPAYILQHLFDS